MAGTNAPAVRTALLGLFETTLAPVRVDYAYNSRLSEREYAYFGHITATHEPLAFRAGSRMPRMEELTVPLHLEVQVPGGTPADADARAAELGALIEDALAADPTQASLEVTGLLAVWVSGFTLTPFFAADGVSACEAVYTITVQSNLG